MEQKFMHEIATDTKLLNFLQKQSPEVSYKKGVLRNFTKFTGKHLCQSLLFIEVANRVM